jgi:hypothetical protein
MATCAGINAGQIMDCLVGKQIGLVMADKSLLASLFLLLMACTTTSTKITSHEPFLQSDLQ